MIELYYEIIGAQMLAEIEAQFGIIPTHYRLGPVKDGIVQFFTIDQCETCNGDVLPANHPIQLVRPRSFEGMAFMRELMALDDADKLKQVTELPSEGFYSEEVEMEACHNCC